MTSDGCCYWKGDHGEGSMKAFSRIDEQVKIKLLLILIKSVIKICTVTGCGVFSLLMAYLSVSGLLLVVVDGHGKFISRVSRV